MLKANCNRCQSTRGELIDQVFEQVVSGIGCLFDDDLDDVIVAALAYRHDYYRMHNHLPDPNWHSICMMELFRRQDMEKE